MQEIIDGKEIKRDSFVLYCDDYELITELSVEEKAALLDAIFLYEINRIEPEIEKGTSLKIVWKSIKGHLNRDWEKYKEKVQRLRGNATKSKGESGEKAKADKSEQMQAKADKSEQIDGVRVCVRDSDSVCDTPSSIPPQGEACVPDPPKQTGKSNKVQEAEALFERLWKEYPVKKGKASVSRKQKLKLLEIGETTLMKAIERYKAYLKEQSWRTPKDGSTFFNSGYVDYLDENYEPSKPRADPGKNRFNNFKQRENDYDEIQKHLVQNGFK